MFATSQRIIAFNCVFELLLSMNCLPCGHWRLAFIDGEILTTRVRLTGMAIGTRIGFALGGFAPMISAAVMNQAPLAMMMSSLAAALASAERGRVFQRLTCGATRSPASKTPPISHHRQPC